MGIYEDISEISHFYFDNLVDLDSEEYQRYKRVVDWLNSPYCPLVEEDEVEE